MVTQNIYRSHSCGELCKNNVGQEVKLSGWVHHRRDHGGVLFIDLRDHFGITQIVFHPENDKQLKQASRLSYESVITITGKVVNRAEETINSKLKTGEIEVEVLEMGIESRAKTLPFQVAESRISNEDLRLRYRFLDLRRQKMQENIILRSKIIKRIREHLENKGFNEFQTPILANSSPEGARDYLVPSRVHPGQFYALPQAPQQYKQLLMMSGFEKYFQIAPCFRDEDARADRSPGEFYQLDIEMAFVTQEEVFEVIDDLMKDLVGQFGKFKLQDQDFPRIPYLEAINKYGTDKPDIRYDLHLADLTEELKGSDCQIFSQGGKKGAAIKAIAYPGGATAPRKFFDGLQDWARSNGLKGLAYIVFEEEAAKGPIVKFLKEEELTIIKEKTGATTGDVVFFAVAKWKEACEGLGALRKVLAERMEIADPNTMAFCWIVDFPMYEKEEHTGKTIFSHNPFSMPQGGLKALKEQNPLDILAWQYDICCNGIELSSGAIRNHKPEIMYKAFEISGHTKADVDKHFGHMIRAFEFGAPPHGGVAPGIDRLVMLFANEQNIREVIAFPKNQKAQDLMVGAPGPVFPEQLAELNIRIIEEE